MRRLAALIGVSLICCAGIVLTSPAKSGDGPEATIHFPFSARAVTCLSFSPDGKLLLTCSYHQTLQKEHNTVCLWLWQEDRKIIELEPESNAYVFLFVSQSELLRAGSDLCLVKNILHRPEFVRLSSAQPPAKPNGYRTFYTCLALSPCRKHFAAGKTDGIIEVWDLATKKKMLELQQATCVTYLAYSEDGSYLVSASAGEKGTRHVPAGPGIKVVGEIITWDCQKNYNQLGRFQDTETTYSKLATYTKDGTTAVLGFKSFMFRIQKDRGDFADTSRTVPTLGIFSLPKPDRLREIWLWPDVPGGTIRIRGDLAVSADKKLLAVALAGADPNPNGLFPGAIYNELLLFELPTLRELVRLRKGTHRPYGVCFSPDGKYLAVSYTRNLDHIEGKPFVDIWAVDKLLKIHGK